MKSISKLKDEARRYEQREEWEKAIQAYLQVLRTADEGETEVELPLYNRVGDLCVRLGKPQEAVRHYEQAADRYAEAGLYNNAIALCNKALRYSPDRLELIRKLGQFSASQGFITDARRYFLDYAERQFNAGKVSEALSALEDFANVSDDADVREMLGRQLQAHGRVNDAVDELRRALALRLRNGETDQAAALREEILAIDPHAQLDAGAPAPSGTPRPAEKAELPGLVDIEPDRPEAPVSDAETTGVEGLETGALPGEDAGDLDPVELAGFETTDQADGLTDIDAGATRGVEGLETTSFDFGDVKPDTEREDLGLEPEATSFDVDSGQADTGAFDVPTLDDDDTGFDLPTLDDTSEAFDLPTLDDPDTDLPTLDDADASDLPLLDEPQAAADLPLLDDDKGVIRLPDGDDAASIDLPLLGDDDPADVRGEANPPVPPQIDDPSALDMPGQEPQDFGLGGDLPIDLNSLGGGSMFDLPAADEDESDTPDWKSDTSFDIPDLDDDALGLTTWEPEPEPEPDETSFDLPPEATPIDLPASDEAAGPHATDATALDEPEATVQQPAAQEPGDAEAPGGTPQEHSQVPAIELPTWDTGILSDDPDLAGGVIDADATSEQTVAGGDAEDLDDEDSTEPSWVDSLTDEQEESSADLPTFTYDDDVPGEADIPSVDEDEGVEQVGPAGAKGAKGAKAGPPDAVDADDDPLGLAAHLAGMSQTARPDAAQAGPAESDWLDDIDDDVADESEAAVPDDGGAGEAILERAEDAEPAEPSGASIEDTGAAAAAAHEAAQEMAAAPPADVVKPPPARPVGDDYIDLGAFIAGDGEDESTRFRVQETAPTGDEDRDFAELLSQFKAKVHEHLPAEDAAAHYDLGLAFKEMGLIDEAIGEFQVALRAGHMRLQVYEELGQCFLQKEQFNIAEKVLSRALTLKFDDELELLGVYYHLGRAYEAMGRRDQARDAYERVLGMDINFGDVTDRLARL